MDSKFDESLEKFNSIMFFVSGDNLSFDSFQKIKTYILTKGFNYGLHAYDSKEDLILYRGGSGSVQ
ncbi:MAG: hypothetical protein JEZ07_16670 [Phycisphaerae bacterium]|nr:hypothetical protein [Phycisphaerae bacterium]